MCRSSGTSKEKDIIFALAIVWKKQNILAHFTRKLFLSAITSSLKSEREKVKYLIASGSW